MESLGSGTNEILSEIYISSPPDSRLPEREVANGRPYMGEEHEVLSISVGKQADGVLDSKQQGQLDPKEPQTQVYPLEEATDVRSQLQHDHEGETALRKSLHAAEIRIQDLTHRLSKAKKDMDEELKACEVKYAELDSKLGKLQKRAKQRIQELQKDKEDLEAQLAAALEKVSHASSQCTTLQNDLERVRGQAGEALRSLDAERQQLRASNHKQKDLIDELQRQLEVKEQGQRQVQHVVSEKEQIIDELTAKILEMEEKHLAFVGDLVAKHQKLVEDFQAQVADEVQERCKATDTISSLQIQLARKESDIAQLDAASSGEVIRLTASLESARGNLDRIEQEHRKEKEAWEANIEELKVKLEGIEKFHIQQELESSKSRSQMESELQEERQALAAAQVELAACKEQISCLEKEFGAYKVRAYSLLQKKEAELSAAKDDGQLAEQEAALKDAQRAAAMASSERDRVLKALQNTKVEHESQLAARSIALLEAEQRVRELAAKLEATKTQMLIEQERWQSRVAEINATWQEKYNSMRFSSASNEHLEEEILSLKESYTKLKEEHNMFQEMANNMVESKDKEISRLLGEINDFQRMMSEGAKVTREANKKTGTFAEDESKGESISSIENAEEQIVLLARQQAQREEELAQCRRHIEALQDEIVELEHENRLHAQQESALKEELRNLERSRKREGVDMTYLKNIIVKLLETGEVEALLPVIGMLLQFSPEELRKCQEVYRIMPETSAVVAETPRTIFSRFIFSTSSR